MKVMDTEIACLHRCDHANDQILIAGDVRHLTAIQAQISLLPFCAYGQVYIEAADASEVFDIATPDRVTVAWLLPRAASPRPRRGELLYNALTAWSGEFLLSERLDQLRSINSEN